MRGVTRPRASVRIVTEVHTDDWINAIDWTPDARHAIAAVADGTVVSVGVDGTSIPVVRHDGPATCAAVSAGGVIATAGHDGVVRLDGRPAHHGSGWVERLVWRPDGARLAVAQGRHVHVLGLDGTVTTSPAQDSTITCLDWHPKGVLVAAGHYGGVVLLRARDGHPETRLAWKGSVLELAVSPDGRRLAHGNQDATVHFWEIAKGRELHMWGYATKVRQLAWRHDGRYLATGGGLSATVWDFAGHGPEGSTPIELEHHDGLITWMAFAPDDDRLATTGDDGMLALWHPGRDRRIAAAAAFEAAVTCAAWSPDGARVAVGTADGTIAICEVGER